MDTVNGCGCSKLPLNYSDEELINLVVKEIYGYIQSEFPAYESESSGEPQFPYIPLGISNRHIHLTEETFHRLFGDNVEFESLRPLYQPGEFASKHTLTIVGPKLRSISNVRILGPLRKYDQVEVSLTDAIFLGIDPPVANSGTLKEAAPLTLVGPNSSLYVEKCAIIANRHIHISDIEAEKHGLKNGDFCKVKIPGEKSTVFENVLVRTNKNWKLQIHLDTDDANAANVRESTFVEFLEKM